MEVKVKTLGKYESDMKRIPVTESGPVGYKKSPDTAQGRRRTEQTEERAGERKGWGEKELGRERAGENLPGRCTKIKEERFVG